jgi:hypothetical protein
MSTEDENEQFDAGAMFDEKLAEAKEEGLEVPPEPSFNEDGTVAEDGAEHAANVMSPKRDTPSEEPEAPETEDQDKSDSSDTAAAEAALAAVPEDEAAKEDEESLINAFLPEQPADDSQAEQVQTADDEIDHSGTTVPLAAHTKLRKQKQAAEARVRELEAQGVSGHTPTGAEQPGQQAEEDIEPLAQFVEENPDEEFVPASVQLAQSQWARRQEYKRLQAEAAERQQAVAQRRQVDEIRKIAGRAQQSEAEFRKNTPDYNRVMKAAIANRMIDPAERDAALLDANPAEALYKLAKARVTAIAEAMGGVIPAPNAQEKETSGEEPGEGTAAKPGRFAEEETLYNDVFG